MARETRDETGAELGVNDELELEVVQVPRTQPADEPLGLWTGVGGDPMDAFGATVDATWARR